MVSIVMSRRRYFFFFFFFFSSRRRHTRSDRDWSSDVCSSDLLVEGLSETALTLAGIDHGFSFPLRYFEKYKQPHDWPSFMDDFQEHWPTDEDNTYVDFVREGECGNGAARCGDSRWRRITEVRADAKSVFHFDVPGSVAKSTHAGIPWLRYLRVHA